MKSPIRVHFGVDTHLWQKADGIVMNLGKDWCDPKGYKWVLAE